MQHDVQLRAAAREEYRERGRLWRQPPFEEAERLRTSAYLEAIASVQRDAEMVREWTRQDDQPRLL